MINSIKAMEHLTHKRRKNSDNMFLMFSSSTSQYIRNFPKVKREKRDALMDGNEVLALDIMPNLFMNIWLLY
ncbi:CLUMA_CG000252, isoform A [Clunio marinus]|uniref:CLUMA_CG000252, isoform A n=1 Tax=Clunio marinus TaxID=568069 RepID=A0A1J1HEY8_9DIPT|nr:CLUMA_CG000252, isoform A [Clunio marinus]